MTDSLEKKVRSIFVICPVREATDEEKAYILQYINTKEKEGIKVYYPARDTNQDDPVGLNICSQNRAGISNADEVHIYWNGKSTGSIFDFGMAFMAKKPIVVFNREYVKTLQTNGKSFHNVLLALHDLYEHQRVQ